ncbi:protein-L-isoaspartate O-methyltransferase [Phlebopus sp. FC_14]|nr:protein-L-isoaspartate O-methyltransferase [Phlebopus sp. FC_14]
MAWLCTGLTNSELINNLAMSGIIKSDIIATAMSKVDRANYVTRISSAYEDSPQPIGHGATISAPHMHAHALEHLLPYLRPGARVLDVGSGSGYLTAVLHYLVSPAPTSSQPNPPIGKVVGIDHIPELVDWSRANLAKDGLGQALREGTIEMVAGDGREGYPAGGPYDAIHVGAASPTLPQILVDQLRAPGRMFIPVGTYNQAIWEVDKDEAGNVKRREVMGVIDQ